MAQKTTKQKGKGETMNKAADVQPGAILTDKPAIVEAGKVPQTIADNIQKKMAEMFYYTEDPAIDMPFEQIPEVSQKVYKERASKVLDIVDKLNLMIIPRRDLYRERMQDKQQIMEIVTVFMVGIQKPKDLVKVFPIEELVLRIMDGRR